MIIICKEAMAKGIILIYNLSNSVDHQSTQGDNKKLKSKKIYIASSKYNKRS